MFKKILLTMSCLIAIIFSSCVYNGEKNISREDFLFDSYVSLSGDRISAETADEIFETLSVLDKEFDSCYETKANELSSVKYIGECLVETSKFNEIYGDKINLSCGGLTKIWGISTENPRVPTDDEIASAILSLSKTDYFGGDTKKFHDECYLDFGAVAKGYACDKTFEILEKNQAEGNAVLSFGSTALLFGEKSDGENYKIAIKDPLEKNRILGCFEVSEGFLSTCGGYERFFSVDGENYCHVLSLEDGFPAKTDILSVSVFVPKGYENGGILSDFLSTYIFLEGTQNLENYLHDEDIKIVVADKNGKVFLSDKNSFSLEENENYEIVR